MANNTQLRVTDTMDIPRLMRTSSASFQKAKEKMGVQMLTWMNAGSPNESATPPIRWGVLRGSSTVFVGGSLVGIYPQKIHTGAGEEITPATSYDGKKEVVTVVWNTNYAYKMHEERGKKWQDLGPFSAQSGNATDKWVEKHLNADKESLYELMATIIRKELGN